MNQCLTNSISRSPKQIRRHYKIEKELANRLRNASKEQRRKLYSSVYDELVRQVPDHPQMTQRDPLTRIRAVRPQLKFLKPLLNQNVTFLEVGPGDCSLSVQVANLVRQVYAIDVSGEVANTKTIPPNFQLILSDGCSIPIVPQTVHVAYSHQVMEHLHPDDAVEQLKNIYDALVPGGIYLVVTPNRLNGPHDVSMNFDSEATGLHLKEYTISEMNALLKKVGFSAIKAFVGARGFYVTLPLSFLIVCERVLEFLSLRLQKSIARTLLFRMLLNIRLSATK